MKFILFFSLLILLEGFAFSQEKIDPEQETKENYSPTFLIEGAGLITNFQNYEPRQGYGGSFDLFLGKKVSTHYVAYFGNNYCEFSPGLVAMPVIAIMLVGDSEFNSLEELGLFAVLLASSFENIALHFNLGENMELSPSFSLCRIRYFFNENNAGTSFLCASGGLGLKINQRVGRFINVGAFAEGNVLYKETYPLGFTTGVSLGIHLPGGEKNVTE